MMKQHGVPTVGCLAEDSKWSLPHAEMCLGLHLSASCYYYLILTKTGMCKQILTPHHKIS
jgi:hypothetical protein